MITLSSQILLSDPIKLSHSTRGLMEKYMPAACVDSMCSLIELELKQEWYKKAKEIERIVNARELEILKLQESWQNKH